MKFPQLALPVLLFLIILPANFAHAHNPYAEAYAVGSQGSTVFQPKFTLNQQPFIYIQFFNGPPAGALDSVLTFSTWTSPGGVSSSPSVPASTSNQIWISFTPSQWDSIKQIGTWDTRENSTGSAGFFAESASFKVTAAPEPAGTVLFLTGALIMGFRILRLKSHSGFLIKDS